MKSFLFYLIQWTWGLPVNAIGGIVFLIFKARGCLCKRFYHAWITNVPTMRSGGLCLGLFIFLPILTDQSKLFREYAIHEYGHTWQVLPLGLLYWIVIGLPSWVWANLPLFKRYRIKHKVSYYDLYCEAWANYWGQKATGEKLSILF